MKKIKLFINLLWKKNEEIFNTLALKWGMVALFIRPIIIALISMKTWEALRFYFPDLIICSEDKEIFQVIVGFIGGMHLLVAGLQIAKISSQRNTIDLAKVLKDGRMFIENACVKMNEDIKKLLAISSFVVLFLFILYPFSEKYTGQVMIFLVMFFLYFMWEYAIELDDIFHGVKRIKLEDIKKDYGIKTYNLILKYLGMVEMTQITKNKNRAYP